MNAEFQKDPGPVPGLDQLARERLPARDLWAGIEARIHPAQAPRRRRAIEGWSYALAASICAAVIVGGLLRQPSSQMVATEEPVAETTASQTVASRGMPYSNRDGSSAARDAGTSRTLRTLRAESLDNAPALVAQRAEGSGLMKANLSRSNRAHSQETILRANLKLVSQAEREVRRALREDPESETLQNLLDAAENRRAELTAMLVHEQD